MAITLEQLTQEVRRLQEALEGTGGVLEQMKTAKDEREQVGIQMATLETKLGTAVTQQNVGIKDFNDQMATAVVKNKEDIEDTVNQAKKRFDEMTNALQQINIEGTETKTAVQGFWQSTQKLYQEITDLYKKTEITFGDVQGRLGVVEQYMAGTTGAGTLTIQGIHKEFEDIKLDTTKWMAKVWEDAEAERKSVRERIADLEGRGPGGDRGGAVSKSRSYIPQ